MPGLLAPFLPSKRRSPLGEIDSVVGGEKKRGTAKWRRDEAWMGRERVIEEGKGEGLIVHPGEEDKIRCLKAATTNPVISWTRIMKTEKLYLLEKWKVS